MPRGLFVWGSTLQVKRSVSHGRTLLLGIAVGAVGIALAIRLRKIIVEQDPEHILSDIDRHIAEIEARIQSSKAEPAT